jgi:hypothetical protein
MMLHARILAQVAIFRAVRAGSLTHGDCVPMKHAALATLLPTLSLTVRGETLTADGVDEAIQLFGLRQTNRYRDGIPKHEGQIIEIYRESPRLNQLDRQQNDEDDQFDQWDAAGNRPAVRRLEARMIYWYRLRIPFADWVMSRMFLAHFGIKAYNQANPLIVADAKAGWDGTATLAADREPWPGGSPAANMLRWSNDGAYLVPIRVATAMRMMVPPHRRNFLRPGCPVP